MEGARRRWIVPVTGAVAAVLTVWGILGVGKASTVSPRFYRESWSMEGIGGPCLP